MRTVEHLILNSPSVGPDYPGHALGVWEKDCLLCKLEGREPQSDPTDAMLDAAQSVPIMEGTYSIDREDARAIYKAMKAAQGTKARRAETVKQGSVHDGPVGGADAP